MTDDRPWLCPRDETCTSPGHDSWHGYKHGCRSGLALSEQRNYDKLRVIGRPTVRFVPSLGVRRRLQGLNALGHSFVDLAAHLDCDRVWLSKLANGIESPQRVKVGTARKIDELFRRLSMEPGPSKEVRTKARRRGWVPPLAWDDPDDPKERPKLGEDELGQYRRKQAKEKAKRGAA